MEKNSTPSTFVWTGLYRISNSEEIPDFSRNNLLKETWDKQRKQTISV